MSLWQSFWDIIWLFFCGFVLVAYLFAMFWIITDLFRDRELNGWWKALWIIALIFVPFLTALVFLIARGKGAAERSAKAAQAQQDAADAYIKQAAGTSPSEEIAKAKALLDAGTITAEDYARIKAKVLV